MTGESTERRFLSSTVASYGSLLVRLLITFGARVVMARLVVPEGHGLYELALRIVIVTSAVRDLGLPFHLMRDPKKPYGTVLAFSVVSGVLMTTFLILGAPLFAPFGDAEAVAEGPTLPEVLRVFALWVLLDGLVVVPKTFFERELRIGRMVLPEILRGLTVAAVSISLAWFGWGVWSFIWADLAAAVLFGALVWGRALGEIRLQVDFRMVPELLRHSRWLFVIWIVLQLVTHLDLYVIGWYSDTEAVGYYSRAYMIAFLVAQVVAPRALVPALVEYRHDAVRFLGAFRMGTVFLLAFQVTGGYFLFFNAEKVVAILLGDQWEPAVVLLKVLCFVPFLDAFTDLGGEVLKVRHEDRTWLATGLLNLVSLLAAGIWLTSRHGALGMAFANFFLMGNLLMAWRMSRIFAEGFGQVLRDLALVYLTPLPFFLAAAWVFEKGSWGRFFVSGGAAALALGFLAWRFHRPFLEFFGRGEKSSEM